MKRTIMNLSVLGLAIGVAGCSNTMYTPMTGDAEPMNANAVQAKDLTSTSGLGDSFDDDARFSADSVDNDSDATAGSITDINYNPHDETYHFAFDSTAIQRLDLVKIKEAAAYLAKHPRDHILLEGNTDERGSREYNIALGERRAKSIADILLMSGVKSSQIRIVSYGQEKPVSLGHNQAAWRLNRRVDLSFEGIA